MIRNIPLFAALFVAIIAGGVAGYYYTKNSSLAAKLSSAELRLSVAESNLAVQQRALAQALEARAVLQSHLDRAAADAEYWRQMASDLAEKEGADEALNPYERAVLDSLRRP